MTMWTEADEHNFQMNKHADLVRYCPNCGSIGEVESKWRDCCPDGNEARQIPKDLATKLQCHFNVLIKMIQDEEAQKSINSKHIVACVNACKGLPDGCLDGGWTALGASQYAKRLEIINTELLEALESLIREGVDGSTISFPHTAPQTIKAKAAIAKARGEA